MTETTPKILPAQIAERAAPKPAPHRADVSHAQGYREEAAVQRRAEGADNDQPRHHLIKIAEHTSSQPVRGHRLSLLAPLIGLLLRAGEAHGAFAMAAALERAI